MSTVESKTLDDDPDDSKPSIEYEVIESDRADLVSEAVYFCRVITDRQCGHMGENAFLERTELTDQEQAAYTAALGFLERSFNEGGSRVRRVVRRREA